MPFGDLYDKIVETLILIGVWLELWYMLQKRRREAIRRQVNKLLRSMGIPA